MDKFTDSTLIVSNSTGGTPQHRLVTLKGGDGIYEMNLLVAAIQAAGMARAEGTYTEEVFAYRSPEEASAVDSSRSATIKANADAGLQTPN